MGSIGIRLDYDHFFILVFSLHLRRYIFSTYPNRRRFPVPFPLKDDTWANQGAGQVLALVWFPTSYVGLVPCDTPWEHLNREVCRFLHWPNNNLSDPPLAQGW